MERQIVEHPNKISRKNNRMRSTPPKRCSSRPARRREKDEDRESRTDRRAAQGIDDRERRRRRRRSQKALRRLDPSSRRQSGGSCKRRQVVQAPAGRASPGSVGGQRLCKNDHRWAQWIGLDAIQRKGPQSGGPLFRSPVRFGDRKRRVSRQWKRRPGRSPDVGRAVASERGESASLFHRDRSVPDGRGGRRSNRLAPSGQ